MLEKKITRREFVKKGFLYTLFADVLLLNCGKKNPAGPNNGGGGGGGPPPPTLSAKFTANPTEGWSPLKVSFNASSSTGNITQYSWNFGDGKTGTGKTVAHTYGSLQKTSKIFKYDDTVFEFKDGIWRSYSPLKPDFLNTLKKEEIEKYSLTKTAVYGKYTTELTVKDAKSTDKATIDIIVNELMPNINPSEYFGKVNNGSVTDNLVVKAEINGVEYYSGLTKNGYYDIIVPADNIGTVNVIEGGKSGDKIQVKINNKNASPLLDFKSGSCDPVNLTY